MRLLALLTCTFLMLGCQKELITEFTDIDTALVEAEYQDKPVIAVFSAPWCEPCKKMKAEVYPKLTDYKNSHLWVYLDLDKDKDVAEFFGVEKIPHIVVIKGKQIVKRVEGYHNEAELRAELK